MESFTSEVSAPVIPSMWAKIHPPSDPVCLSDIMSEQLANDMQIKEDVKFVELFEESASNATFDPNTPDFSNLSKSSDCDSDEMIALMLQAQFDKEHDNIIKQTEKKYNDNSKVSVSFSKYRVYPDSNLLNSDSEDDSHDVGDDKQKEWDSFVSSEKQFKTMPKCGYKKDGDTMVTKHDMLMSSRRNACRVMSFPPEFHTGDGGGFDMKLSNKVFNSLKVYSRQECSRLKRHRDKIERATTEMGIDPKTRLLLFKMVNQEILDQINGILSTGKESIVMHADGGSGSEFVAPKECAIKIFKTTLNEFKTRDKYIEDDFRFKDRFSKQNPRKIIHLWAEKEMHNLKRMKKANIACPDVVVLKKHILVMSFVGENHVPAPKLKEAILNSCELNEAFEDVISTMKTLYSEAKLVHADLSEYNILWHNGKCWYIDVSQAVERNHPRALEFLLRDCTNVCSFFKKSGIPNMISAEDLFKQISNEIVPHGDISIPNQISDFEKNDKKLKLEKSEKTFQFDYYWSKSEESK